MERMNMKQATEYIKNRVDCRNYLKPSKSGLFNCPVCGSGEGANHTGAVQFHPDTNRWNCNACGEHGTVIDLYMYANGMNPKTDFARAVDAMAKDFDIEIEPAQHSAAAAAAGSNPSFKGQDNPGPGTASAPISADRSAAAADLAAQAQPSALDPVPAADYTAYYKKCMANLAQSEAAQDYLQGKRGIDIGIALAYGFGFDPKADPAGAPGGSGEIKHPCPRIIIPTGPAHYVGRSIDPNTAPGYSKINNKGGRPGILNEKALFAGYDYIFVTEGAFDAVSIATAGQVAIALNSASNADLLLKRLEERPTKSTLILCLDNDKAGNAAANRLKEGLRRLNISYLTANICGTHKDPNEALTADRAAFEDAIRKATSQNAARPDNTLTYLDEIMAGEIEIFKQSQNIKTGFENLDKCANGLYPGFYILAAITSLGKTTLALQVADNLAAAGHDVLFFSMEQSRLELVSKSLSRLTAQANLKSAVNGLSIRQGNLPLQVIDAVKRYKQQTGERLSIIEGNFNCDMGYISDYIRRYMQRTGTKPIVFIDYLQILQPSADGKSKNSKKEEIDLAVTELKRLSRELDLTIIVISSLNRTNYLAPFAFEALKETGQIEYTADVVWGLQLACLDEDIFDAEGKLKKKRKRIEAAKRENPRQIKLVCIKNRYGVSSYECNFSYYPQFDLFIPAQAPADEMETDSRLYRSARKI